MLTGLYFQTANWNQAAEKDGMEGGARHRPSGEKEEKEKEGK